MNKLVSILIPVYNREKLVIESIESALSQTYDNIEIVIVDNASTDKTWEVVQKYANNHKVKLHRNETNIGPVYNWIECLNRASGYYANFLYSDDILHENFIEVCVSKMQESSNVGFVRTKYVDRDKVNNLQSALDYSKDEFMTSQEYIYRKVTGYGSLPNSPVCCLFRLTDMKQSLTAVIPNPYDWDFNTYGAGNDLLLHLNIANKYKRVVYTESTVVGLKGHEGSFTTSNDLARFYFWAKIYFCKKNGYYLLYFLLKVYLLLFGMPRSKNFK